MPKGNINVSNSSSAIPNVPIQKESEVSNTQNTSEKLQQATCPSTVFKLSIKLDDNDPNKENELGSPNTSNNTSTSRSIASNTFSLELDLASNVDDEYYIADMLTPEDLKVAIRDKSFRKQFFSLIPLTDGSALILLNHLKLNGKNLSVFGKGAEGKVRPGYFIHPDNSKEYVAVKKELAHKWFRNNPKSGGSEKAFSEFIQNKQEIADKINSRYVLPTYVSIVAESKTNLMAYSVTPIVKGSIHTEKISDDYILPNIIRPIRELLTGLRDIHSKDIVHRDLSIDNLFVGLDGRIIIGDLGSAKQLKNDAEKVFYRGKEKIQTQFYNCDLESQPPPEMGNENYTKQSEIFTIGFSLYESIFHFQKGMNQMERAMTTSLLEFHNELKTINNKIPENYESYKKEYPETSLDEDQFNIMVARLKTLIKNNTAKTIDDLLTFMDNFFLSHDERPSVELLLEKFNNLFPVADSEPLSNEEITFEPASKPSSFEPQEMLSNSLLILKFSTQNDLELNTLYTSSDDPSKLIVEFERYVKLMYESGNDEVLEEINTKNLNLKLRKILENYIPERLLTDDESDGSSTPKPL